MSRVNDSPTEFDVQVLSNRTDVDQPSDRHRIPIAADVGRPSHRDSWEDLLLQIPTSLPTARIISLVECALVELTHEPVGAGYISDEGWGTIDTIYFLSEHMPSPVDEPFVRHHVDPRLGRVTMPLSRAEVREELIQRLTRSAPVDYPANYDVFAVRPLTAIKGWYSQ